ncbi:MAG: DNA-directed RNA polymerase subunit H [Candidatus Methanomethylicia archaeon]
MSTRKLNIFSHVLVPKHEILTKEEAIKILHELNAKPEDLPLIKVSDPVVKALGAKPGDILKIYRRSPTAGVTIAYRYVTSR